MSVPGPWGRPGKRKASRLGLYLWLGVMAMAIAAIYALEQYFPSTDSAFGGSGGGGVAFFFVVGRDGIAPEVAIGGSYIREKTLVCGAC